MQEIQQGIARRAWCTAAAAGAAGGAAAGGGGAAAGGGGAAAAARGVATRDVAARGVVAVRRSQGLEVKERVARRVAR